MHDAANHTSERVREIVAVFAKHGLAAGTDLRSERAARQLREACDELGTTFVKLAQLLSTRGDILPETYTVELSKLQDSVHPIDPGLIVEAIESELGASPFDLFESFEIEPLACASIGQVHAAQLLDGRSAIVKVRKPGVRADVEQDLEILGSFAHRAASFVPELAEYDVSGLIEEFSDMLRAELSYTHEAANINTFRSMFDEERDGIALPSVVSEFSTDRVLTLTYVEGWKLNDGFSLDEETSTAAVERIARFLLEPALVHGVFYADPHPGNVVFRDDGTVGFVDFGMVGRFSEEQRRHLGDILLALSRRDEQRLTDRLVDLGPPRRPVDRVAFQARVSRLIERDLSSSLQSARAGATLIALLDLARDFRLRLPAPVSLFFKAVALAESIMVTLSPQTSIEDVLEPVAERISRTELDPKRFAQRARRSAMETAELGLELPRRADRVLADIERGNLRVWARIEESELILRRLERIVERANATMLVSALIVGVTILLAFYHPRGGHGLVAPIFWIGIALAVIWLFRTGWASFRKTPHESFRRD